MSRTYTLFASIGNGQGINNKVSAVDHCQFDNAQPLSTMMLSLNGLLIMPFGIGLLRIDATARPHVIGRV